MNDRARHVLRWRLQAPRVSIGLALCSSLSPHLPRRHTYLDCRVNVELHMPLLSVRDAAGGDGARAYQSPNSCHGVYWYCWFQLAHLSPAPVNILVLQLYFCTKI
ncbi:hypothetical protein ACS0TY_031764 [Phlomoides rotata]